MACMTCLIRYHFVITGYCNGMGFGMGFFQRHGRKLEGSIGPSKCTLGNQIGPSDDIGRKVRQKGPLESKMGPVV